MKTIMGLLALVYAIPVLFLAGCQSRILYQPHVGRGWVTTPDAAGLAWESVQFAASDGVQLDAWWIPADEPAGALLFFHGNAGNISHRMSSIQQFHRMGLSVFIIDYRGYGKSEGRPSEKGTALDAQAAYDWMLRYSRFSSDQIVIFGRSLGAAVAAELSRDVSSAAVILESPFRSVPALARSLYPWLPTGLLVRYKYPVEQYVANLQRPLLIIHSRDDEIIPFAHGRSVYEAAAQPKQFLSIQGGHNTGYLDSEPRYSGEIAAFLQESAGLPVQ